MRVYELSKELGISNKEALDALHAEGFDVASHMSVLPENAADFLSKKFNVKGDKTVETQRTSSSKRGARTPARPPRKTATEKALTKERKPEPFFIEAMSVGDFAARTGKPVSEVVLTLLRGGVVATINYLLPEELVKELAATYGVEVADAAASEAVKPQDDIAVGKKMEERPPVVVVMGHVDHGKTSLLDFIRKTRAASREKGGITQHIGAYEVEIPQGSVVFLDTPGHEAFSAMRLRGAKAADVAVLVIAADDSVMPQTVEAIKHAKAMNVPIIVAINKIDKADPSRLDVVKRDLSQHDLLPEEWGGDIICVPVSAKTGEGIDNLLELLVLQSQMMELKADATLPAHGFVLEARLKKGFGSVATLICQQGTVRVGDYFVCGNVVGRVNSLIDSAGQKVLAAGPSVPVQVAGFSALPEPGDVFRAVPVEEYKKARSSKSGRRPGFVQRVAEGSEGLNFIVKVDSNSTKEALLEAIQKVSKKSPQPLKVVHVAVGDVSEGDIELASHTGSRVVGLHVKVENNASTLAKRLVVPVERFDIIYKLLERLAELGEKGRKVEMVKKRIGEAVVRRVFDIKGLGVIAGSYVKDGRFVRNGKVVVWRGNDKVGEGPIKSLQRDKKTVKEIQAGFECAFLVDGFDEWQVDDRVECFIEVPAA